MRQRNNEIYLGFFIDKIPHTEIERLMKKHARSKSYVCQKLIKLGLDLIKTQDKDYLVR